MLVVSHEMADRILRHSCAFSALTGASEGTPEKPVDTVFLGLADRHETHVFRKLNPYDRETFKFVTAHQGMELLRRKVLGLSLEL